MEPKTRRRVLMGALGGLAALAAGAVGRPSPTDAATGDVVHSGKTTTASASTVVSTTAGHGLRGMTGATSGGYFGVRGETKSSAGAGVSGYNGASSGAGIGVKGVAGGLGSGVYGFGGRGAVGETNAPTGWGVKGMNTATTGAGFGVAGYAFSPDAAAVYAENSAQAGTGVALRAKASTDTTALIENVSGDASSLGLKMLVDGSGLDVRCALPAAPSTTTGVFADTPTGTGLEGQGAIGVRGQTTGGSPTFRVGVWGSANGVSDTAGKFDNSAAKGLALDVDGGLRMRKCVGQSTLTAGHQELVVNPNLDLNGCVVFATMLGGPDDVSLHNALVMDASTFKIRLTGAPTSDTIVVWMVVRNN